MSYLEDCKSPGPDGIFPSVLKNCSDGIATLPSKIYHASIDSAYLPRDWRTANITPIFKKGDRQNPANFRPVSLNSIPCKTLEHIVYHHLVTHFEENYICSDIKHGFRKRRGCDTQLLLLIEELASAVGEGRTSAAFIKITTNRFRRFYSWLDKLRFNTTHSASCS